MPDAAAGRDPPDLRREAEEEDEEEPVNERPDTDSADEPPGEADRRCGERGIDPRFPLIGDRWAEDHHDRHQRDPGERRERNVDVPVQQDHVLVAEPGVEPDATVEERVGEIEEVATRRVEQTVRQPVDRHGENRQPEADLDGPIQPIEPRRRPRLRGRDGIGGGGPHRG